MKREDIIADMDLPTFYANCLHVTWHNPDLGDGIFVEDLIELAIARLYYLNDMLPCEENTTAIRSLIDALSQLNTRVVKRHEQGLAGTDVPHK